MNQNILRSNKWFTRQAERIAGLLGKMLFVSLKWVGTKCFLTLLACQCNDSMNGFHANLLVHDNGFQRWKNFCGRLGPRAIFLLSVSTLQISRSAWLWVLTWQKETNREVDILS